MDTAVEVDGASKVEDGTEGSVGDGGAGFGGKYFAQFGLSAPTRPVPSKAKLD